MTAAEQIEEVLTETIAALPRLRPDELEDLERRAGALAERFAAGGVIATPRLRAQMSSLKAGLETTAGNLAVLNRILGREVTSPWEA
jgi:hypothetical protein